MAGPERSAETCFTRGPLGQDSTPRGEDRSSRQTSGYCSKMLTRNFIRFPIAQHSWDPSTEGAPVPFQAERLRLSLDASGFNSRGLHFGDNMKANDIFQKWPLPEMPTWCSWHFTEAFTFGRCHLPEYCLQVWDVDQSCQLYAKNTRPLGGVRTVSSKVNLHPCN
jgi:hypothetical protein